MPTIISAEAMSETVSEAGWTMRTIADAGSIGFPAMVARWWIFPAGTKGPQQTRGKADELLYVIRGSGKAVVDGQEFELDDESVLWVEEGEKYYFVAGDAGLEILQGYAPGDVKHGE
jgi:mannose-6-phosphate isomerase-like protein (cupin superfamily)